MVDYHPNYNCTKFTPNIFNKSKCSQCFHTREDHRFATKEVETQAAIVKCGYLFIAPFCDFSSNSNRRSKRWQRRWFILRNDGQLTYALDEHPEAIPQGCIQMSNIQKIEPAENITLHEFSFSLYGVGGNTGDTVDSTTNNSATNSTYLKGASNDESKAWMNSLSRYVKPDKLYKTTKTTNTHLLRGDPDGGENNSSPSNKKGWISTLYNNKWQKQWYTLEDNILKFYQNQSEEISLQSLNVNNCNVTTYDDAGFYCFKLTTMSGEFINLHVDSEQSRVEWINNLKSSTTPTIITTTAASPTSPVSTPSTPTTGISSCKTYFANRKSELDKLSKEVIKSQAVQIDNLRTKLNAGFLEIEKLEFSLGRSKDYEQLLQAKDQEINQLKQSIFNSELIKEENNLLAERINDLTNKLYNTEKNTKLLQKRLQRYKSQSIKDKELQTDIYQKIEDLELKMSKLDGGEVKDSKKTLINAILKLNELDDRIEKAEWYKCTNCEMLNNEIECRDERLKELEVCVGELEVKLGGLADMREDFKEEVMQMKSILKSTISSIEASQSGIVLELMEKHRREIVELEIKHDQILAEETQATRAALEVLKKNHDLELQRQMNKFRAEYLEKMKGNIDLDEVIESQETQLDELKHQLVEITEKYTEKCLQLVELEKEMDDYREKDHELCS